MNDISHLILSSTIDYSTDLVCIELEKRQASYLRINRDLFSEYEILYDLQDGVLRIKMRDSWHLVAPESLQSIYFRAPVFLRTTGKPHTVQEQLKRSQWSAFIRNLIIFDKALWINHPVATYRAENKLFQLKCARECGLAVPETYVGNSLPASVAVERTYIVKSLDTALFYNGSNEMFTYSTMISGQTLMDAEIKTAPIILQEYLSPKTDLRVTVIKDHIFSVAITKQGNSIVGDWRQNKKEQLEYNAVDLPDSVKKQILTLMRKLGLSFGGVDLALVGNTYYFIEVNPTGEWGWLALGSHLPIDKAIVDCMVDGGNP